MCLVDDEEIGASIVSKSSAKCKNTRNLYGLVFVIWCVRRDAAMFNLQFCECAGHLIE